VTVKSVATMCPFVGSIMAGASDTDFGAAVRQC